MNKYRKLPNNLEEPLSNYLYKIVHSISNVITDKIKPNEITLFNILLRIIIINKIKNDSYDNIFMLFMTSCVLDYLDGYTARRYNMITKLGDYLDHFGDNIFIAIILYMMYKKIKPKMKMLFVAAITFLLTCIAINIGCQQKYYSKESSDTIDGFKKICFNVNILHITKYFGVALFYLFIGAVNHYHKYFYAE